MQDRFWKAFVGQHKIAQDYGNFILWLAGFKESEVRRAIETGLLKEDGVRNYEVESFKKFLGREQEVKKVLEELAKIKKLLKELLKKK